MRKKPLQSQKGFGLTEFLAAIAVIGIASYMLSSVFVEGAQGSHNLENTLRVNLAREQVDIALSDPAVCLANFGGVVLAPAQNLKRTDVIKKTDNNPVLAQDDYLAATTSLVDYALTRQSYNTAEVSLDMNFTEKAGGGEVQNFQARRVPLFATFDNQNKIISCSSVPLPPRICTTQDLCNRDDVVKTTLTQTITFPETKNCAWNQNGNLGRAHARTMARTEQYVQMDTPANSKMCNLSMNFPAQPFEFDDQYYFLLNGVVLSSNYDSVVNQMSTVSAKGGVQFRIYDWSSIVGKYRATSDPYCLASGSGGTCSAPRTERAGTIILNFDPSIFQIMADKVPSATTTFGMVADGDNDNKDCFHSAITFSATVTYVAPQ